MWEQLTAYRNLDKKVVNSTFKKFSQELITQLNDYAIERTSSVIKLYRLRNNLEQAIFIEKHISPDKLQVRVCVKPTDFYKTHKFTMVNIVPLGDILGHYRKSFYPLSEEWLDLATYLSERIKNDVEKYFDKLDSYEKIIEQRNEIEPKDFALDNKYELLIYAAIKTRNSDLLTKYIAKKIERPTMQITKAEFLKGDKVEINDIDLLNKINILGQENKFEDIDELLKSVQKK